MRNSVGHGLGAAVSGKSAVCVIGLLVAWVAAGCAGDHDAQQAAKRPRGKRDVAVTEQPADASQDAAERTEAGVVVDAANGGSDAAPSHDAGTPSDAASGGSAGRDSAAAGAAGAPAGGAGGAGAPPHAGAGGEPADRECTPIEIRTDRVVPKVWLLIDGSGSMADGFAGPMATPTRWDALRQTLLDPSSGVVPALDDRMKFGMVIYDGPLGGFPGTTGTLPDGGPATGTPPTTECPRLISVEPELNSFAKLDAAFPMLSPGGSTPTHKAMAHILSLQPPASADSPVDPTYVLFATDGAPNDFCAMNADPFGSGGAPMVQGEVISLTQRLAMQGIPVYVISLAAADQMLTMHLTQVAEAGGTKLPPFTPETKDRLIETFRQIIGPEVLCTIKVSSAQGLMSQAACKGTVTLNGAKLDCDSDNGWRLRDSQTIEITGMACDKFKNAAGAQLTASFPCETQL